MEMSEVHLVQPDIREAYRARIAELVEPLVGVPDSPQSARAYAELLGLLAKQENQQDRMVVLRILEDALVKRELQRRSETRSSVVLTPRQERMIEEIVSKFHRRDGTGVAILYGPPGTGKTTLALLLAARLQASMPDAPQLTHHIVCSSTTPLPDEILVSASNAHEQTYFYESLKESLSTGTDLSVVLLAIFSRELTPFIAHTQDRGRQAFDLILNEIGITGMIEYAHGQLKIKDGHEEAVRSRTLKYIDSEVEIEQMMKINRVAPGPAYVLYKRGGTIVFDELSRAGDVLGPAGQTGLEDVLEPKTLAPGNDTHYLTVLRGALSEMARTTSFIGTTNDYTDIPEQVRRRFDQKELIPSGSDLIFIARTLLADQSGRSILAERPGGAVLEHQLCILLQFWTRLSHQNSKAFSTEALVQLCAGIKNGESLGDVLNSLIKDSPTLTQMYAKMRMAFNFDPTPGSPLLNLTDLNAVAILRDMAGDLNTSALDSDAVRALERAEVPISPIEVNLGSKYQLLGGFGFKISGIDVTDVPRLTNAIDGAAINPITDKLVLCPSANVMLVVRQTSGKVAVTAGDFLLHRRVPVVDADGTPGRTQPESGYQIRADLHTTAWIDDHRAMHVSVDTSTGWVSIHSLKLTTTTKKDDGITHEAQQVYASLWHQFQITRYEPELTSEHKPKAMHLSHQGILTIYYEHRDPLIFQLATRPAEPIPVRYIRNVNHAE